MKVLVLCKRFYTGKDVAVDRFGRLFELPEALAAAGHDVRAFALGYRFERPPAVDVSPLVRWRLGHATPPGLVAYRRALLQSVASDPPDVIWASSDLPHAVLGAKLGARTGIPVVIDLYDDYESFGLTRLPGGTAWLRRACRAADGLTVVSRTLAEKVERDYGVHALAVLGNGVRKDLFRPRDVLEARRELGLPEDARLIGTVGALDASRGIDDLWQAFLALAQDDPRLHLVVAGPRDASVRAWRHPRLHWLGELPLPRAALVVGALDVAVICNRDSPFGRSCHPLKFVEAIASGRPLVAATVGDVGRWLASDPEHGYRPGHPQELAERIRAQLERPVHVRHVPVMSWREQGDILGACLESVVARRTSGR